MCLSETENNVKAYWHNDVINVLYDLSAHGFVPIDPTDPIARLLIKYNIAGHLPYKAYASEMIPDTIRMISPHQADRHNGYGLIPTTQMMRMAIALKLMKTQKTAFRFVPFSSIKLPHWWFRRR